MNCSQHNLHFAPSTQRTLPAARLHSTAAAPLHPTAARRRSVARAASASSTTPSGQLNGALGQLLQPPQAIAEPIAFTKAFATVLLRHVTEFALDTAAELSIQAAEQPKRMREFAEEVQAAAERELQASGHAQQRLLPAPTSASSSSQALAKSGGSSGASQPDLAALIDDLRADIAASRSLLQQIRTGSNSTTNSTTNSSSSQAPSSRR